MIETIFLSVNSDLDRGYTSKEHNLENYIRLEFKEGAMTPSILRNGAGNRAKSGITRGRPYLQLA